MVLLKDIRNKLKLKTNYPVFFGDFGKYISTFALSRILLQMGKFDANTDKNILLFANNMQLSGVEVLDEIILIVDKL